MPSQEAPSTSTDASDRAGPPAPKRQKAENGDLRIKAPGDNSLKNVGVANTINHGPVQHNPPLHGGFGPSQAPPQTPQPAPRALTPTNIAARRLLSTPHLNPMAPPFQPQTPVPMASASRPRTFVPLDPVRPQHPRNQRPTSSQPQGQVSFPYPPMLNSLGQVCPRPSQQRGPPPEVRSPKFGEEKLGYFTNALHDLAGELTASGFEVPFSVSDDDMQKHSFESTWEQFVRDFNADPAQDSRALLPSDLPPDMLALFRDNEEYVKKNINASKEYFNVPRVAARAPLNAGLPVPSAPGAPANRAIQPASINSGQQQTSGTPVRPHMQPAHVVYGREQTTEGPINPAAQPASSNGSAQPKNGQQQTPADGGEAPKMPPMGHFPTRPAPPPKRKSTKRKSLHEASSGAPDLSAASSAIGGHANGPATGPSNRAQPASPGIAPENPHADFHIGIGFRSDMPSTKTELGLLNTPVDRRISHPSPHPAAAQPPPARQPLTAAHPAQPTAAARQGARQGARQPSVAPPPLQPNAGPRQSFMDSHPPHMRPPASVRHPFAAPPPVQAATGPRQPFMGPPPAFHGPPPHADNHMISRSTLKRTLTRLLNARRVIESFIAQADAGRDPAVLREQACLVETAIKSVGVAAVDLAQGVRVDEYWPNVNLDLLRQ
ncbi:hypothetical protein CGLO_13646 [Colletotrichum gloeosporioides Cg-14]|uniref:Uncharacterized protein n=1 Tax=Colletotrichum gloeosporioides (strain Cg-14) TaxID=1237896 RepID=T0K373_COLGC|nr:hypothetical protein CGLO_13646 [Colletotrichum gloeosporioides Cg-14]